MSTTFTSEVRSARNYTCANIDKHTHPNADRKHAQRLRAQGKSAHRKQRKQRNSIAVIVAWAQGSSAQGATGSCTCANACTSTAHRNTARKHMHRLRAQGNSAHRKQRKQRNSIAAIVVWGAGLERTGRGGGLHVC